jgi:A/G-specific adenine glycosylase
VPPRARVATLRAVRRRILAWYLADHRDLPFRRSREPWPVLVAEVMLQQTQASRISERFDAFLDRYPSPASMAAAMPAQVLADWSGLGYNRRALNLHSAAVLIARDGWPDTVEGLESLPGIGPYSARAITSIAFSQAVGAVDTNVRRWLVRRFAVDPADRRALQGLADRLAAGSPSFAPREAGTWTHATMEFGARICTARGPRCDICPVSRGCPSRSDPRRVPVPRQSSATAGSRAARGAVLRALATAPNHRLSRTKASQTVNGGANAVDYREITEGLERDGLLHRSGTDLILGPR